MTTPKVPTLSATSTETRRAAEAAAPDTADRPAAPPRPTRIAVEASGDGARFALLDQGLYLAPRPVAGGSAPGQRHLRVALIGIHMMLLGGDDVRIEIAVGAGVTLEVIEPAGMVAYDAEGRQSRWCLDAVLGEGAVLIWEGAAFVGAEGSNVLRETRVRMGPGARFLLRETLVLGRSGEAAGPLRSITRLSGPETDYLYEDLDLHGMRHRAVGILGGSKVMGSVTAAGWRPEPLSEECAGTSAPGARRFELAQPGAVTRALTGTAHAADRLLEPVYAQWKAGLLAGTDRNP